jgi:1,2-diacylglycerol 3-alpha-glucosyltransferase
MRILVSSDLPKYFVAGSNTFVTQLAHRLQQRGHEVAIVCASRRFYSETYTDDGILVFGVSSFPSPTSPSLQIAFPIGVGRQIIKVFKTFRPDIVHIQSHGPLPTSVIKIASQLNIPSMGTNHFVPDNIINHLPIPRILHGFVKYLMWKHLHAKFKRLDSVTTPTETAQRILFATGFQKNVKVISNGIDLARFHASDFLREALLHKYNLKEKPTLLSVGRLDPEKNIQFLIETLPLVIDMLDMQLIIVGTGKESRHLKKLVRKRHLDQHVIFTDYLPSEYLPAMYRFADCFVMPGTAELQGIAVMEAMASGLPVIAADALALPELIQHGKNGFLFSLEDSQTVAKYIASILNDKKLQRQMGAKSLEMIQKHDIAQTVDAFEALYKDVIQGYRQVTSRGNFSSHRPTNGDNGYMEGRNP